VIRPEYAGHQPSPAQARVMDRMRHAFSSLHTDLEMSLVHDRYCALALAALEEAAMWTNKAIVLGEVDPQP